MNKAAKILVCVSGLCLFAVDSVADDLCNYCGDYRSFDSVLLDGARRDQYNFVRNSYDTKAIMPERIAIRWPAQMSWAHVADGLCNYCDDLHFFGTPRSDSVPNRHIQVVSSQVHKAASISTGIVAELIQAARTRAADQLCNYCEDPNSYGLDRASQSAVPTRLGKSGNVEHVASTSPDLAPLSKKAEQGAVSGIEGLCNYCDDYSSYSRYESVAMTRRELAKTAQKMKSAALAD